MEHPAVDDVPFDIFSFYFLWLKKAHKSHRERCDDKQTKKQTKAPEKTFWFNDVIYYCCLFLVGFRCDAKNIYMLAEWRAKEKMRFLFYLPPLHMFISMYSEF